MENTCLKYGYLTDHVLVGELDLPDPVPDHDAGHHHPAHGGPAHRDSHRSSLSFTYTFAQSQFFSYFLGAKTVLSINHKALESIDTLFSPSKVLQRLTSKLYVEKYFYVWVDLI